MDKENEKQLTFYFIRHGKTVWNTEGLMQGHGDSPLTKEGINGAKKQVLHLIIFLCCRLLKRIKTYHRYCISHY